MTSDLKKPKGEQVPLLSVVGFVILIATTILLGTPISTAGKLIAGVVGAAILVIISVIRIVSRRKNEHPVSRRRKKH